MKTVEEQKRILAEQIEKGNLFAWNDGDGGVFEAIANSQTAGTYKEAEEELANELYSEKDMVGWPGWSKVDLYRHATKDSYSDEARHTWIYDLKEYLEDL